MKSEHNSDAPAIGTPVDSLTALREVSHMYERLKAIRKDAARAARANGHTFQAIGDELGVTRGQAHRIVNEVAA